MKFNYKKIASVFGGVFLIGATFAAGAAAAGLPMSFIQGTQEDVAAIHGASAHANDVTAANSIGDSIALIVTENTPTTGEGDYTNSLGVEEEITLGGSIVSGKILERLTDNKIPSLADDKFNWDDGNSSDNTFNYHEEILIDGVNLMTSLDDNEFEGVALTNNKGLSYRFVFEEDIATSLVGDSDADTLYLSILGQEYEIDAIDSDSITVVTSEEVVLDEGETVTIEGVTFELVAIGEDSVSINGAIVNEGRTKRIDGMEVQVDSIFYKSSGGSMVVLKIGKDITTEYNSGDEFIGENEDDPEWIWDISNPGTEDGYIGVTYDHKNTRAKDDGVVYEGGAYEFPMSYAAVRFEGLTEVSYDDYEVSFIEDKDLWGTSSSDSIYEDVPVVQIEGPTDESIVVNSKETDTMYLRYATNTDGVEENEYGAIEVYYVDVNKDVSDSIRPRYIAKYALDEDYFLQSTQVAKLVVDDTIVDVSVEANNGNAKLILNNGVSETVISLNGETLTNSTGTFERFGALVEDAEGGDITVDGKNIGTEDNDVMDHYGMIITSPENNADDDRVSLSIPSEQVEAKITVIGQGVELTDTELPTGTDFVLNDASVALVEDKNLIIVGGSCINNIARQLLGETEPLCGDEFTAKTGVGTGQYMIEVFQSPYNTEKVAILVAGFEKEDTTRGVADLLSGAADIDLTTVGEKVIA